MPDTTDYDAPLAYRCPQCKAEAGQRCRGSARAVERCHLPRQDRYISATRRGAA